MKTHSQIIGRGRRESILVGMMLLAFGHALPAAAVTVTVWEDQFTDNSTVWEFYPEPTGLSIVSQAVPGDVIGSEDGFEGRFTNTAGGHKYAITTIPAGLVQAGDRVEYSIRTQYPTNYSADRINLVAPVGGTDFDSGFVAHDSAGALTYQKEPGTLFDLFDTTLMSGLRPTDNLWFGNASGVGAGVEGIFYVDYIRIIGERTAIDPDFNGDGTIDAADYVVWRKNNGSQAEYDAWLASFGMPAGPGGGGSNDAGVPEPASACLAVIGAIILNPLFRRRRPFRFSLASD